MVKIFENYNFCALQFARSNCINEIYLLSTFGNEKKKNENENCRPIIVICILDKSSKMMKNPNSIIDCIHKHTHTHTYTQH